LIKEQHLIIVVFLNHLVIMRNLPKSIYEVVPECIAK